MAEVLLDILFAQAIRFYLFDFYVFKPVRDYLHSFGNKKLDKLLICPFCHGFWVGLLYYSFKNLVWLNPDITFWSLFAAIRFGFITSFLAFAWLTFSFMPIEVMEAQMKAGFVKK